MSAPFLRCLALIATTTLAAASVGCASPDEELAEDEEAETIDPSNSEQALAGAGIVPPTSIRGIRLGITKRDVRNILGAPEKIERWTSGRVYSYTYGLTQVTFFDESQRVKGIYTRSPGVRTKDGVGTGSLKNAVDALPGATCKTVKEAREGSDELFHYEWYQWCEIRGNDLKMTFWFPMSYDGPQNANAKVDVIVVSPD
jgi:hypothetical protein